MSSLTEEQKREVRKLMREREAKNRQREEELRKRRLDKSGRPQSGLVDTDETVYED
jgi:hypothetical protein